MQCPLSLVYVNGMLRKLKQRESPSMAEQAASSCLRLREGAVGTARNLLLQQRSFQQ